MKEEYKGFMAGDTVKINRINDIRKELEGKTAVIEFIDDAGQLHTSVSSVALIPEEDDIILISGKRNGNRIFKTDKGYVAFLRATYENTGSTAVCVVKTDSRGKYLDEPEVINVNLAGRSPATSNQIVIHNDYIDTAAEIVEVFIRNFTDGTRIPVKYGSISNYILTLNKNYKEQLQELK